MRYRSSVASKDITSSELDFRINWALNQGEKVIDCYFIMAPFQEQVPKKVLKYGTPKPKGLRQQPLTF